MTAMMPLLIGLGVGLIAILIGAAVFGSNRGRRVVELQGPTGSPEEILSLRRNESDSNFATLDRAVKRWVPRRAALRERLARTGRDISIGTYVLICIVLFLVVFLLETQIFQLGGFLALLLAGSIGIGLPHFVVGMLGARRLDRSAEALLH